MTMGLTTSRVSGTYHAIQLERPLRIKKEVAAGVDSIGRNTYTFRLDPQPKELSVKETTNVPKPRGVLHSRSGEKNSLNIYALSEPSTAGRSTEVMFAGSVLASAAPQLFAAAPGLLNGLPLPSGWGTTAAQWGRSVASNIGHALKGVPILNTLALTFMPRELGDSYLPVGHRKQGLAEEGFVNEGFLQDSPEPQILMGGGSDRYWLPEKEEVLPIESGPIFHWGGGKINLSHQPEGRQPHVQRAEDLVLLSQSNTKLKQEDQGDLSEGHLQPLHLKFVQIRSGSDKKIFGEHEPYVVSYVDDSDRSRDLLVLPSSKRALEEGGAAALAAQAAPRVRGLKGSEPYVVAYVDVTQGARTLVISDINLGKLPRGSAGEFAASAVASNPSMLPISGFRIENIGNRDTLNAYSTGKSAQDSVLGRFGERLLSQLGYKPVNYRFVMDDQRSLHIESDAAPTAKAPSQFFHSQK